jgi:hypothetical protein
MDSAAVLTPFLGGNAIELGNKTWRKRVLPVGDVLYKGRTLHFTKDYLSGLEQAFRDRAYDYVPFQLATGKNEHTNDPERFRGAITAMELDIHGPDGPGLYFTLNPTDAGEKALKENPYLGVSARIVEEYDRSDGKHYPAAVQHVLGTHDPRIPGLGAWQAIEAANTPAIVIDLTGASFAGEEVTMPELTAAQQANLSKLLNMDPAALDKLVGAQAPPAASGTNGNGKQPDNELSDQELADLIEAMSEEDLEAMQAEFLAETGAGAAATGLTAEAQMAIDLANSRADETERQLGVFQMQFEAQSFEGEKRNLADLGVPPYITELARPLLQGSGHTIDLANGQRVDAGQVMRKVLSEYARMAQMLDLGVELGTSMDEPPGAGASAAETARADVVSRAKQQMGLGQ